MQLNTNQYKMMANAIRFLSMDAVEKAQSGHPGMPMGMADVATVLFSHFLNYNPEDARWINRDRFILSAGHGSMLQYALLYLTGYKDINLDDIKNFRQLGSKTAGHPEFGELDAIETTTGPLGQGLANAVGMALAEKILAERFGADIMDHYTYVIVGDGCLMEGISHEAISMAGHLNLSKLIVLFDDNKISIDGPTDLTVSDDHIKRFEAMGFATQAIDGHDHQAIYNAIAKAKEENKPSFIACSTKIGFGAPKKEGTSGCHGSPLGADEIKATRERLGWAYEAFEIPNEIKNLWEQAGKHSVDNYNKWQDNFNKIDQQRKTEILDSYNCKIDFDKLYQSMNEVKHEFVNIGKDVATRKASGDVLAKIIDQIPEFIGGSADLTGSNLTKTKSMTPIAQNNFKGNYIYYGVREHAMGAVMNGMSLHGGIIPYSGTFLVFADYFRPAIRLAALMKRQVIYVMTHDSIGLGEDGPTHQPVEHLASLRAIPNLYVMRPADAVETAECWQLALEKKDAPTLIALTRQNLAIVRKNTLDKNLSSKGAYILAESDKDKVDVTIFSSGSEIEIALKAKEMLEKQNLGTRVVSMVCDRLFNEQSDEYFHSITCNDSIKVAIEAASGFGWEKYIGAHGIFVGMKGFGASAPYQDLYKHFKITAEEIVLRVNDKINQER